MFPPRARIAPGSAKLISLNSVIKQMMNITDDVSAVVFDINLNNVAARPRISSDIALPGEIAANNPIPNTLKLFVAVRIATNGMTRANIVGMSMKLVMIQLFNTTLYDILH